MNRYSKDTFEKIESATSVKVGSKFKTVLHLDDGKEIVITKAGSFKEFINFYWLDDIDANPHNVVYLSKNNTPKSSDNSWPNIKTIKVELT